MTWLLVLLRTRDMAPRDHLVRSDNKISVFKKRIGITHRDACFFPNPEAFIPTRWAAPPHAGPARYAYLPFGGGPRQCLGEGFAWMEGLLVLATLAQMWRMQRVPGPPVAPWGLVTLRPKQGIQMHLARR